MRKHLPWLSSLVAQAYVLFGFAQAYEKSAEVAERAGFEPAIELPLYTLSRRAPSTTRPPLRPAGT